jgi:iron complex outermembrane receptor protein
MASGAFAQPASQQSPNAATAAEKSNEANAAGAAAESEIVITARRRAENLQDVPSTVNAVTGETIEKLNLQDFKDIQTVVPGLELKGGNNGFDASVSLRGVTVDPRSSAQPVVQFYVNEVVVDPNLLFQSMFDVGQVEVLRGPQGTLRGRSAPAGAITITTRRPALDRFGGYADMTGDQRGNINLNGAVNLPIINHVLALRIAGLVDHDDAGRIKSVNSRLHPFKETEAVRGSLRFEPTDTLSFQLAYQKMWVETRTFTQVAGQGAPGPAPTNRLAPFLADLSCIPPAPCILFPVPPPAGYNGPVIEASDRLAVGEGPTRFNQRFQLFTANADWRFSGQKLSYVGGWQNHKYLSFLPQDTFNQFTGEYYSHVGANKKEMTHELRLSSEQRIAGIFDYTVGVYFDHFHSRVDGVQPTLLTIVNPFATTPVPGGFIPRPILVNANKFASVIITLHPNNREFSYFGTITAHFTNRTELTVGARHIHTKDEFGKPYRTVGQGTSTCIDFPLPPTLVPDFCFTDAAHETPTIRNAWVWNASLSHRFSDQLLAYANAGTSFRPGPFAIVTVPLEAPGFQSATDFRFLRPEKSRGIEVGVKATFFDGRATLNVAAYRQKYKDYIFLTPPTYVYDVNAKTVGTNALTANGDAIIKGVDVEAAARLTPEWTLSGAFSWTKGNFANDEVPCNDSNFDGVPDTGVPTPAGFVNAGVIVARCVSNAAASTAPRWTLSLQSEYARPVSAHVDGFIRGLFTYYPKNPNRSQGITIDSYGILNLFAGIRSPDNAWEVSLFAKNATKTSKLLSQGLVPSPNPYFGQAGYLAVDFTPRRQIGLNVRYAFGSR